MKKDKWLFCDIGNSYTDFVLTDFSKMERVSAKTKESFTSSLDELFDDNEGGETIAYVSSVNRRGFDRLVNELQRRGIVIKYLTKKRMSWYADLFKYDIPNLDILGQDLFCDLIATKRGVYRIIYDIGTATKFLVIDQDDVFLGASILPGPDISKKAVYQNTDLKGISELKKADYLLSYGTEESLCSGSLFGTAGALASLTRTVVAQAKPERMDIYVTGGGAELVKGYLPSVGINKFTYDRNLTIVGLAKAFDIKNAQWLTWVENESEN